MTSIVGIVAVIALGLGISVATEASAGASIQNAAAYFCQSGNWYLTFYQSSTGRHSSFYYDGTYEAGYTNNKGWVYMIVGSNLGAAYYKEYSGTTHPNHGSVLASGTFPDINRPAPIVC